MRTLILAAIFASACSDDGAATPKDAGSDAPTQPDAGCFAGEPTTHEQIINACTTAQKIYKSSKPPLQNTDGSLPPLPP